jgi:hypothetical protein
MRLPLTMQEISPQWLTDALRQRHPTWHVESVEIIEVMEGTSTKIRVRPRFGAYGGPEAMPDTLIVKGGFEAHSPAMQPMYLNEMRFYRDVQSLISIRSPICYFAGTDEASHQSIVIMEDLVNRGVEFCHALRPQSYAQVSRRLASIARYHAQTWNSADFQVGGNLAWVGGRHEGWSLDYQHHYLEPERWQHYMQLPRSMVVSRPMRDRSWMMGALQYLAEYHRRWPLCLHHGDTHLGNLYIEQDGEPGFFDAQVSRGPWQLEVTYHLIAALDIADRRRWERDLLREYLASLSGHGIDAPSFDDAWEAHRREIVYGLFIFLINETGFQTEAINTAYAARFGAAALDHQTVELTTRQTS